MKQRKLGSLTVSEIGLGCMGMSAFYGSADESESVATIHRALANMDDSRARLDYLRRDPRVSLTVLDADDWYRHVSLIGRVVSIADDNELVDIDRLAVRYTGRPFRRRDSRRVSAWLEPARWHAWSGGGPWSGRS